MLFRVRGQLPSRTGGLQREDGCSLLLLCGRLRALRGFRLLQLRRFVAGPQSRRLLFIFPLRSRNLERKSCAPRALLFDRLTKLLRVRGQFFSCGGGLQRDSGCLFALFFQRSSNPGGFRLLELYCFVACLHACRLLFIFALRSRKFARQYDAPLALLFERQTMLLRAGGQLFSRRGSLPRESGRFFTFCFKRSRALGRFRPPGLRCLVPRIRNCRVLFIFPRRRRTFARQCDGLRALLFERLTVLFRARGRPLSRGGGLQREGGCFFALFFERSRVARGFRLQLHIEPRDSGSGVPRLLRPSWIVRGLLRFRRDCDLGLLRSLLRFGWRAGLVGLELTGVSRRNRRDLSAEIRGDERRRNES